MKKKKKEKEGEVLKESALKGMHRKVAHLVKTKLWLKVLIGLFLGIIVGIILGPDLTLVSSDTSDLITNWLALPGNLFLQLVKMIVIPLVFSSIIVGILSSGEPNFLKKIGPRLVLYFLITTVIATTIGFGVALTIKPGNYISTEHMTTDTVPVETQAAPTDAFSDIPGKIVGVLPSNPLESMVTGDMLGIVLFTILFGLALMFVGQENKIITLDLLEALQEVSMTIVKWAMVLVPYAVFGLMTQITSQVGIKALLGLGMYIITVLLGLVLLVIVYLIIIKLFTFREPGEFLKKIVPVQLLAFSTSSSAAVMPLSLKTAEDKLKIKPAIAQFLIPVGATINMDGTALYQVVATVFLAQVFGVTLPLSSMILIVAITVGASIGTPSAPGVGIVILATILESVGIPAAGIAMILGVDRILDMSRTTVNVTGDLTACSFFNKQMAYMFEKK